MKIFTGIVALIFLGTSLYGAFYVLSYFSASLLDSPIQLDFSKAVFFGLLGSVAFIPGVVFTAATFDKEQS